MIKVRPTNAVERGSQPLMKETNENNRTLPGRARWSQLPILNPVPDFEPSIFLLVSSCLLPQFIEI